MKKLIIISLLLGMAACSNKDPGRTETASEEQKAVEVVFNYNGGSDYDETVHVYCFNGRMSDFPDTPRRSGYVFEGWYTDLSFENSFDVTAFRGFYEPTVLIFEDTEVYAKWSPEIYKIKFVSSKDGLNIRLLPSVYSSVIRKLLFGDRIIIQENGKVEDTIDGIKDYWYQFHYADGWVFGRYLLDDLPLEAPVVLGKWEDRNNSDEIWEFTSNNRFWKGFDEHFGEGGTWELVDDTLKLHSEFVGSEVEIIVKLIINDRNSIGFKFPDEKTQYLVRSSDLW